MANPPSRRLGDRRAVVTSFQYRSSIIIKYPLVATIRGPAAAVAVGHNA
jgi:hypothetical protein